MTEGHTKERLKALQALPLERKIGFTAARICEWYHHYDGKVYVSFSGGKDSTVLLDIARKLFPDIRAMFVDTGLEYPEIREFVKSHENIDIRRPKMNFKQVIDEYGFPVISKEVAKNIYWARRCPNGSTISRFDPESEYCKKYGRRFSMVPYKFLLDSKFKISDMCCTIMKKKPAKEYEKETGLHPIVGTMTIESRLRETEWLRNGCNSFDGRRPVSHPMSFWTEQDVLEYIKLKNLPIASVYGEVVGDRETGYRTTGCYRTGCVFCLFGIRKDKTPNRIQRLAQTHPKLYDYCLNKLGMRELMEFINVPYKPVEDPNEAN